MEFPFSFVFVSDLSILKDYWPILKDCCNSRAHDSKHFNLAVRENTKNYITNIENEQESHPSLTQEAYHYAALSNGGGVPHPVLGGGYPI